MFNKKKNEKNEKNHDCTFKATAFNFIFASYFFAWSHHIMMEGHDFIHFVGSRAIKKIFLDLG